MESAEKLLGGRMPLAVLIKDSLAPAGKIAGVAIMCELATADFHIKGVGSITVDAFVLSKEEAIDFVEAN
jgi:hypothetical protein